MDETEVCEPSLKDGTLRLVGGRDETEVCEPSLKDGTLHLVGGMDETDVCEPSLKDGTLRLVEGRDETEVCGPSLNDGTNCFVGGREETEVHKQLQATELIALSGDRTKHRYLNRFKRQNKSPCRETRYLIEYLNLDNVLYY